MKINWLFFPAFILAALVVLVYHVGELCGNRIMLIIGCAMFIWVALIYFDTLIRGVIQQFHEKRGKAPLST
jgi:hypothetical protein